MNPPDSIMKDKEHERITISVIVTFYNRSAYLNQLIGSLSQQTRTPDEIIFVDDCSNLDEHNALIEECKVLKSFYRIITLNQNSGPGAARNIGIAASNSEWIAILDSDDFWQDEKLAWLEDLILKHPQCGIATHSCFLDGSDKAKSRKEKPGIKIFSRWRALLYNPAPTSSCIAFKRNTHLKYKNWKFNEDYEYFLRMALQTDLQHLHSDAPLCRLSRPLGSSGGLSEHRTQMRIGGTYTRILIDIEAIKIALIATLIIIMTPIRPIFRRLFGTSHL